MSERVLMASFSCTKYNDRVRSQQETWISDLYDPELRQQYEVVFFTGPMLGVPDDYTACVLKASHIYKWALEHGFKRMFKFDDDTYVNVRNLRIPNADYAGIRVAANYGGDPPPPQGAIRHDYASGGAYWLSERSLNILANADAKIYDTPPYYETCFSDRWDGQVLGNRRIFVEELPGYRLPTVPLDLSGNLVAMTQLTKDQMYECHEYFNRSI